MVKTFAWTDPVIPGLAERREPGTQPRPSPQGVALLVGLVVVATVPWISIAFL